MASGKTFNVGSGLTDVDRMTPPAVRLPFLLFSSVSSSLANAIQRSSPTQIGSIITYRFQELTKGSKVPRFPTYVGVRADMDEPNDPVVGEKE